MNQRQASFVGARVSHDWQQTAGGGAALAEVSPVSMDLKSATREDARHPIISLLAVRSEGLSILDRLGPEACVDRARYDPRTQTSRSWRDLQTTKADGSSITGSQTQQGTQGGATGGMTTGGTGSCTDQDQCDWSGDVGGDSDMDGD